MAIQHCCYISGLSYAVFMSFGQRIKNRRGDLRMTGDDLGRRLSPQVSKQTIAHWEADRYRPHVDQVAQLCLILGLSADTLVLGVDNALSPRAQEIAAAYDALPPPEKARMEMLLGAMGMAASTPQTWETGNSDRAGKPRTKEIPERAEKIQNKSKGTKFGPALTEAFSYGSKVDQPAKPGAAVPPPRKRSGSRP